MEKYYFGDIVREVKVNIDRKNNPYKYYIAGNHMDTDELRLLRRGKFEGSDVGPAFHRLFKMGQVLYGSRRTYLRKVAVADFEGITANTTFVLETKDESILTQRLLPFIMQSECFTEHSIKRSKGSTNPYVLFSDLCDFEVDLPPIDKQYELADVLWSIEDTRAAYQELAAATEELVKSRFIEMFGNNSYPKVKASEVCDFITKGTTPPSKEILAKESTETVPYLKVYNLSITGDLLFQQEPQYVSRKVHDGKLSRSKVYPNDVLMNIVGPPLGKFALVSDEYPEWNINQAIAIFRAKEQILPKYLLAALMQEKVMKPFIDQAVGVRQLNISLEQCRNLECVLPPIEEQQRFVNFVEQADKSKLAIQETLEKHAAMKAAIMRTYFH